MARNPFDPWDPDEEEPVRPPELTVEVVEPAEIGRLYATDGSILAVLYDRRIVPFGYVGSGRTITPEPS